MSLIVDARDQEFCLYEMLNIQELFGTSRYGDYSKDMFEMALELSRKITEEEMLPFYPEGDRVGAKLENGEVRVPECFKKIHKVMNDAGLFTMAVSPEAGGQGFPYVIDLAARDYYVFHMGFLMYQEASVGAAHLLEAETEIHDEDVRGKVGRHHGADRSRCRFGRWQPEDEGRAHARRQLPNYRLQNIHLRR